MASRFPWEVILEVKHEGILLFWAYPLVSRLEPTTFNATWWMTTTPFGGLPAVCARDDRRGLVMPQTSREGRSSV